MKEVGITWLLHHLILINTYTELTTSESRIKAIECEHYLRLSKGFIGCIFMSVDFFSKAWYGIFGRNSLLNMFNNLLTSN